MNSSKTTENISIVVVGASGDLATKKIFPALFDLFCQKLLPPGLRIFGFARTPMSSEGFRKHVSEHITCRYTGIKSCTAEKDTFLSLCHYIAGNYSSRDSFVDLYELMQSHEPSREINRIYYLAIPPSVFLDAASRGRTRCLRPQPAVVQGRDRETLRERQAIL